MSHQQCPNADDLLRFVDTDLAPEVLERIEHHLRRCSACSAQVASLRRLIDDVAASPETSALDLESHVATVMQRVRSEQVSAPRRSWMGWGAGLAAAATLSLWVGRFGLPESSPEYTPRGGDNESSLSRDVGLQLYSRAKTLKPLGPGSKIHPSTPLTMGVRNLGKRSAYLLLFALDTQKAVHWIAPEYVAASTDPVAFEVVPSSDEQLSPTAVVFDDLAVGPLRVIALITPEPTRVSQVEQLSAAELESERLMRHFPKAEVRQLSLQVQK